MKTTRCPLCSSDVIVDDEAYEGDLVDCANCSAELEISSLHPLRLAKSGAEEADLAGETEIGRD